MKPWAVLTVLAACIAGQAREIHVSPSGSDSASGTAARPVKTISEASRRAEPGDTITIHRGIYREWVNPRRGGSSPTQRITYRAAKGEKATITGAEPIKSWTKVSRDTWKAEIPNTFFKGFNPYAALVKGDWFDSQGGRRHRGGVIAGDVWLEEASSKEEVLNPASGSPKWWSSADGDEEDRTSYLFNLSWMRLGEGPQIRSDSHAESNGPLTADCSEGGRCVGWIASGHSLLYKGITFGARSEKITFRAAAPSGQGGRIEMRLGGPNGALIGTCLIGGTGDWQTWQDFYAPIKPTSGVHDLFLAFKTTHSPIPEVKGSTVIYAQFPGRNPNLIPAEILVRPTVFTPTQRGINYITVQGLDLRGAATNWAPPTAGQVGLITAYWSRGWIIEDCEVSFSRCSGIALGKYSDRWDGTRGTTEGYCLTIEDALKKDGWTKEKVGSHLVRNCHIHHCGQTGVVGSLGCAFSQVVGCEIHDINLGTHWGGAEMAGIKFHGAIDVVIKDNHIYRCGEVAGIWLDWMAQGTQVLGNLLHDNGGAGDLFCEVNHGPYLVANNLMLSPRSHLSNSRGGAYLHNLFLGSIQVAPDGRRTPFMRAHSTQTLGMHDCPVGDSRWINNIFVGPSGLADLAKATLPFTSVGNVFAPGAQTSGQENAGSFLPKDPQFRLSREKDGWWLNAAVEGAWGGGFERRAVSSRELGRTLISKAAFENPDGSPFTLLRDYHGRRRSEASRLPGPLNFLKPGSFRVKVWPKDSD